MYGDVHVAHVNDCLRAYCGDFGLLGRIRTSLRCHLLFSLLLSLHVLLVHLDENEVLRI